MSCMKALATQNTGLALCSKSTLTPDGLAAKAARVFTIINRRLFRHRGHREKGQLMKKILWISCLMLMIASAALAQLRVSPLPIKERKLPNGLTLVSLRDNSSPSVSIHVWYNVGSKNDPA